MLDLSSDGLHLGLTVISLGTIHGDLNADGLVNGADLGALLAHWE